VRPDADDGARHGDEQDGHAGHKACAQKDGEGTSAAGAGGIAGSDGVADGDGRGGGDAERDHIGVSRATENDFVGGQRDGSEMRGHDGDCPEGGDFENHLRGSGQAEGEQCADASPLGRRPVCEEGVAASIFVGPGGVYEHSGHVNAGGAGGERGAADAERGKSKVTVDEDPVTGEVDEVSGDEREGDGADAADSLKVAAEASIDEEREGSPVEQGDVRTGKSGDGGVDYFRSVPADSHERPRRVIRPANYAPGSPGYGYYQGTLPSGQQYAVINLQGRVFMGSNEDPFRLTDSLLAQITAKVIVVDFHAEATSEKAALGWYLDGRVTAVIGTHTHVPTADNRVLNNGTAYQTDVGMSGPYDSIIGVEKELVLQRFLTGMPGKFEAAKGDPRMAALLIECDAATGRAFSTERLLLGE